MKNKMFGIIFLIKDKKRIGNGSIKFTLYFHSLAELNLFHFDYSGKYYYPQIILMIPRRKKSHLRRYDRSFLPSRELYIDYNYAVEFNQDFGKIYMSSAQSLIIEFMKFVNLALLTINISFQKL